MADKKKTLADILRERKEQQESRGDVIDAAVGDATAPAKPKKPKPKPKPKEKVGTGTSSFDLEGAVRKLRARIDAAQDQKTKDKLKARIEALKANQ